MSSRPPASRLRNGAVIVTLVVTLLAVLFIDLGAAVEPAQRPSAQDVGVAQEVWSALKRAQGTGATTQVEFSAETIAGFAALLSDVSGIQRVETRLTSGVLSVSASIPLPLGLWLNTQSTVAGAHAGFPVYRLKVGRIGFPPTASRWLLGAVRWSFASGGAQIPPLDELVRRVKVEDDRVIAEIALPKNARSMGHAGLVGDDSIDRKLVRKLYCQAAADQRKDPADRLPVLVNRLFAKAHSSDAGNYNRAAFVALSLLVIEEQAHLLAPEAPALKKDCPPPSQSITLHGRADLAKHWVFSAALTSVLGATVTANLGEWKELSDSLQGGSGFSFVDLAADRAGMKAALLSRDPKTSALAPRALSLANEEDLLPRSLLAAPEGLSEASFADRFGNLEAKRYTEAVARIDQVLAVKPIIGQAGKNDE
jgi:hypothetical protein